MRRVFALVLAAASAVAAFSIRETRARASLLDVGAEVGVQKRSLSNTDYKAGVAYQLHAEIALIPPILMIGPYVTFQNASPQTPLVGEPSSSSFRTIGGRVKLKLPTGSVKPYGVLGVGWVHSDFPDQRLQRCLDPSQPSTCAGISLPSATANFMEVVVGGGLMIELAPYISLTAEFNWRPTTGYQNDTYEKQIQNQSDSAPPPSRNGYSYSVLGGLVVTL